MTSTPCCGQPWCSCRRVRSTSGPAHHLTLHFVEPLLYVFPVWALLCWIAAGCVCLQQARPVDIVLQGWLLEAHDVVIAGKQAPERRTGKVGDHRRDIRTLSCLGSFWPRATAKASVTTAATALVQIYASTVLVQRRAGPTLFKLVVLLWYDQRRRLDEHTGLSVGGR